MAEMLRKTDVKQLILYSDDLVGCLKNERDVNYLKHCVEQSNALRSHCHSDYVHARSNLEDLQKKINLGKQKTDAAKAEVAADTEINFLQKELEEELQKESLLKEELRGVTNEINDLERQRISIEERRQVLKKLELEEMRAQMKLSMYASVTNIIPNLDDESKISGHIVDKEKKVVEKFEFDPLMMTNFDTCSSIWKVIT